MQLRRLSLKDRPLFDRYLGLSRHELSAYAFTSIYVWRRLFEIKWMIIEGNLCIFFKDRIGSFLYLPALGKRPAPETLAECFRLMDKDNVNPEISRIENVEEKDIGFYRSQGYLCEKKSYDYLCLREALVNLRGNKFKPKRSSFNYFVKNYHSEILPFRAEYKNDCLELYKDWSSMRSEKTQDDYYRWLLEDSFLALQVLLADYRKLGSPGIVVKVEGKIRGFTFGFALNRDTFCVLFEITDLSVKGLAQYIFRQFCVQLKNYKYVNIMDDSGLDNLRNVKLSYGPQRQIPAYIVKRAKTAQESGQGCLSTLN